MLVIFPISEPTLFESGFCLGRDGVLRSPSLLFSVISVDVLVVLNDIRLLYKIAKTDLFQEIMKKSKVSGSLKESPAFQKIMRIGGFGAPEPFGI